MPRLNIKSTKAAFVKELKSLEEKAKSSTADNAKRYYVSQYALLAVARELEISINDSEFK